MIEAPRPRALVLSAPGINRDDPTKAAFEMAGAEADIIPIKQLASGEANLDDYQIFAIPGGFSYGDHIQSGRVLALEFIYNNRLRDGITEHLVNGKYILGVCNGFQALVQCGLLPFSEIRTIDVNLVTLAANVPNQFQSRWIELKSLESKSRFVRESDMVTFPVAHGEGRFITSNPSLTEALFNSGQVVFQYVDREGQPTQEYPANPNGSTMAIAGITDMTGQILGLMPHPEDFVRPQHYPNWRRTDEDFSIDGLEFFKNIVNAAKEI